MSFVSLIGLYGAGLLTFASPCILPLVPLYLGILAGAGGARNPWRLRLAGIGFSVGLGLVFVVLGFGASLLSATLTRYERSVGVGAGVLMALFGLSMLGVLRLPGANREARPLLDRVPSIGGFFGGFLFGAAFGIGWTPCVGPLLGSALGYAASATSNLSVAATMLGVYALGLTTPLVLAAFASERAVRWSKNLGRFTPLMTRVTGALLVAMGVTVAVHKLGPIESEDCAAPGAVACESPVDTTVSSGVEGLPEGPALIQFSSSHCPVCRNMRPIVEELERKCPSVEVKHVNVDEPGGKSMARHYAVNKVPTFLSVDSAGGEVARIIGESTEQRILAALGDLSDIPCANL